MTVISGGEKELHESMHGIFMSFIKISKLQGHFLGNKTQNAYSSIIHLLLEMQCHFDNTMK
jgi:hypothetical protein